MSWQTIFSFVPFLLLTTFVLLILWAGFTAERENRQWRETLEETPCPVCGAEYGPDVVDRAFRERDKQRAAVQEANPDLRISFSRTLSIRCSACFETTEQWPLYMRDPRASFPEAETGWRPTDPAPGTMTRRHREEYVDSCCGSCGRSLSAWADSERGVCGFCHRPLPA